MSRFIHLRGGHVRKAWRSLFADARLAELLSVWHRQRPEGQEVVPASLCRDCPELPPELPRQLDARQHVPSVPVLQ